METHSCGCPDPGLYLYCIIRLYYIVSIVFWHPNTAESSYRRIQTKSPWLTHGALALRTEHPESSRFPSLEAPLLEVSYIFGRCFYPKQLALHSSYTFYHLLQTHDLVIDSIMCYHLSCIELLTC